jgi:hypothetical protein
MHAPTALLQPLLPAAGDHRGYSWATGANWGVGNSLECLGVRLGHGEFRLNVLAASSWRSLTVWLQGSADAAIQHITWPMQHVCSPRGAVEKA